MSYRTIKDILHTADGIKDKPMDTNAEKDAQVAALEQKLAEARAKIDSLQNDLDMSEAEYGFRLYECISLHREKVTQAQTRVAELEAAGTFEEGKEAAALLIENGRFLHDDAPPKRFANEVVPKIRAIQRPAPAAPRCQMRVLNGVVAGIAQCSLPRGHLGVCDFSGTVPPEQPASPAAQGEESE